MPFICCFSCADGVIDMRQIAPTIAGILNVKLPTAKESPLPVESK
jgi:hypothetical protein